MPTRHDAVLVDGGNRLSAAEMVDLVDRVAAGLRSIGVRHGSAVAWQLPNWWESVVLLRACWRIGAVGAPLLQRAGRRDVEQALQAIAPSVVLAAAGLPLAEWPGCLPVRGEGDAFVRLTRHGPLVGPDRARPHDLAIVMLTSGTSGRAKAVLHTHRSLLVKARAQGRAHGLTGNHTVLMPAPLGHVAGVLNGITFPGVHGMKTVLVDRWEPARALQLVHDERVEFIGVPAPFLQAMVDDSSFDPRLVESLAVASMGGSSMTPSQLGALGDALGCQVKRSYGSTEAPTVTTTLSGDDPSRGWSTDGRIAGEAELRVVEPSTGNPVGLGAMGEIELRGPELFAGYADPAETRSALRRGWFRTGDLAQLDDAGYITIVGRLKELIIRGGENIATAEVEVVLEQHPLVRQAVAVGFPDPVLGERVAACVVADPAFDLDECRRWFVALGIARFKTPERIVAIAEVPLLASGKPDRAGLRRLVERGHSWT